MRLIRGVDKVSYVATNCANGKRGVLINDRSFSTPGLISLEKYRGLVLKFHLENQRIG
ncbi:hypothetical protein ETAA8_60930 [Anatilimnocola aggregata]|uniref:Uncharacterized protein n=1 Tax=Anatilimnocola aggregata TaxID=2528021 RepID=A0A517YL64_9BACT|nr:hypothetical protein ETAA8_60930 [Anatilimnocola aggregata]